MRSPPYAQACLPEPVTMSPLPFGVQCVPRSNNRAVLAHLHDASPLPFGVKCVPRATDCLIRQGNFLCLHCLSAFSAFPAGSQHRPWLARSGVSIAFRPSLSSPHPSQGQHAERGKTFTNARLRSVCPSSRATKVKNRKIPKKSPLPFGVQCVPSGMVPSAYVLPGGYRSPLSFGV